jgi:hypothetical protein
MLVNQAASDSIESAAWQQGHAVDLPDRSSGSLDAPCRTTARRADLPWPTVSGSATSA